MAKKTGKKKTGIVARGKRKEAVARASIKKGTGKVRFNGALLSTVNSPFVKQVIAEPIRFFPGASQVDIEVIVNGGGTMGQAQACRTAIAKAIVEYSKDEDLRAKMLEFDRSLLVEDPRRVEPKKFKGPKARARFTKSYR